MKMETQTKQRKELTTPSGLVVAFTHEKGSWPMAIFKRGQKIETEVTRRTRCSIAAPFTSASIATIGEAYCSPSDTFEYELGRQYALYDALKGCRRATRVEVMQTYLGRLGAKPWRLTKDGHVRHAAPPAKASGFELIVDDDGHIQPNRRTTPEQRIKIAEAITLMMRELIGPVSAEKVPIIHAMSDLLGILVVG